MEKITRLSFFALAMFAGYIILPSGTNNAEGDTAELASTQALALRSVQDITTPEGEYVSYDKALEIEGGSSETFEGLTITVEAVETPSSCNTASSCQRATLKLSKKLEESRTVNLQEGEVVEWEEYSLKLSQVAPETSSNGTPYRIVLLANKE